MSLLIEARKRLKRKGKLLLTTPVGNVYSKINDPTIFTAYNNSTHIQFFMQRSLKNALSNTGFNKIKYRYIPALYVNQSGSKYSHLWQLIRKYYIHYRGQTTHLTYFVS